MDGKASGTSRDLKLQFGLGYQLQLQFQDVPDASDVEACGNVPVCAHLPAILMSFRARRLGVVQRHIILHEMCRMICMILIYSYDVKCTDREVGN